MPGPIRRRSRPGLRKSGAGEGELAAADVLGTPRPGDARLADVGGEPGPEGDRETDAVLRSPALTRRARAPKRLSNAIITIR